MIHLLYNILIKRKIIQNSQNLNKNSLIWYRYKMEIHLKRLIIFKFNLRKDKTKQTFSQMQIRYKFKCKMKIRNLYQNLKNNLISLNRRMNNRRVLYMKYKNRIKVLMINQMIR